jgi:creatinine amidohydrolase
VSYWHLIIPQLREIGTSEIGGMGHACEMETSLQLHLRPELVSMADAVTEMGRPLTPYSTIDFRASGPLMIALDFRRDSTHGVMGDPTVATAEKGAAIAEAVLGELVRAIETFEAVPLPDHEGTPGTARPDTVSDT